MIRNPPLLDFQRFYREVWARKYKKRMTTPNDEVWSEDFTNHAARAQPLLQSYEGEEIPGFIFTTKSRANVFAFREVPEFNAMSYVHTASKAPPQYYQAPIDIQQTAQGKPVWNSEHHLYNHGASTPSRVRYHVLQTFLAGQFKSSSYNRIRNTDAKRRPRHVAETGARHQINRHEDAFRALAAARADAEIAVLYTEGNRDWNLLPEGSARPDLGGAIEAYGHVGALGKHWKYVLNEDVSPEHVAETLVVDTPWLLPDTIEKINALPEDRDVVVVGEIPSRDEYGQDLPAEARSSLQERATVIEDWESLTDAISPAEGLRESHKSVRQANFYWWTGGHGRTPYGMPVPKLEVRRATRDGSTYVSLTNHAEGSTVESTIPWADGQIRELTSEDPTPTDYSAGDTVTFEPESVNVYELL
jgi:hypothetical protein